MKNEEIIDRAAISAAYSTKGYTLTKFIFSSFLRALSLVVPMMMALTAIVILAVGDYMAQASAVFLTLGLSFFCFMVWYRLMHLYIGLVKRESKWVKYKKQ